jgi:uncharacterized protein
LTGIFERHWLTMNDNQTSGILPANARSAAGLAALISRARHDNKGPAPVDRWEPAFCGDIDMEIRRDGTWFYMGTPIGRMALVELFASVLRKDADGKTYLVTPVEKVGIRVEDAHFQVVEIAVEGSGAGQTLTLRTNVGDVVAVGPEHALRFAIAPDNGGLKPYVHVRGRLEALFSRATMYELVALGEEIVTDAGPMFAVRSHGMVFDIMPIDALNDMAL